MRKKIILLTFCVTLVIILMFLAASAQLNYQAQLSANKEALKVYINAYDAEKFASDDDGAKEFSKLLNGARVTFVSESGEVMADSHVSADELESHSDRREISDAILNGEGYDVRSSSTLKYNMVYYARKVREGLIVRVALATPSEWETLLNALPTAAIYIVLDALLCVLLATIATYVVLSPVKSLARAANGNEDVNTNIEELKPIADILNSRNHSIKSHLQELEDERRLVMQAQQSKDEFIANVTHEMNTPLTSIRGYAELLKNGEMSAEREEVALDTIIAQSDRLTSLIACIINYSEIDNDTLETYEVDLSALAHETVVSLSPEAEQMDVTLIEHIAEGVTVQSREERIREILGNLMRNAIRYNKSGGSVTLNVYSGGISVEDTGIGIAEENLDKVFSRFFTVDKSHSGKNGGFGLGLAVVKKLCQKAGWNISVTSHVGEGSAFKIEF